MPLSRKEVLAVVFVSLLAVVIRAILIPGRGHATDIATFEAWMNSLIQVGPHGFYGAAGFVDYPPGYMIILWVFGLAYHAWFSAGDFSGDVMRLFVKLPAIIADIGLGYLTYLIARRYWPVAAAIVAMAVFLLNPASWLVSAYWGQADSVAAVFLVWALYLSLTDRFEFAWLALAFAVLIKPQPLSIAPLLLLWQIKRQGVTWRLALIPFIGVAVAYAGSVGFVSDTNPFSVLAWLYDRYHTGIGVYPYNSVNALNLYSINRDFFQPDTQPISFFGLNLGPQYDWGIGIFLALTAAAAWRMWRASDAAAGDDAREISFLTACFVVMLGFFMVLTRQHERYLFSALAIAPLLWNAAPIIRAATVVLSATFSYNLFYALQYLAAPSVDLNPLVVHPLSFVNFVVLVLVAGSYLIDEVGAWTNARLGTAAAAPSDQAAAARRSGPNPFEGLLGLQPLDYAIVAGLTIVTGVLLFWNITTPAYRIFDEIYYARAAQEYLQHHNLYEWTHPPLTKLIMAAGAWFFGKFGFGDPFGARMANATMGTLTVPLLYAFAKRLFSSTGAAVVAVVLLVASGWFYVQARIATPEISVAFFSLLALYCFYRYWSATQVVQAVEKPASLDFVSGAVALGIVVVLIVLIAVQVTEYNQANWSVIVGPYLAALAIFGALTVGYAFYWSRRRAEAKLAIAPDGSYVDAQTVMWPWGDRKAIRAATLTDADVTTTYRADAVEAVRGADRVTWHADGKIDGSIAGMPFVDRQRWGFWLVLTAVGAAGFVASKWNGLFGFGTIWLCATAIAAQQYLPWFSAKGAGSATPRRFGWGNPIGIRLPLFYAATLFGLLVVYVLTYAPNWSGAISTGVSTLGQNGFAGLLSLQYQMWHYHSTLTATHLYASKWWTWPLELRPVSYDYKTITGVTPPNETVAEIVDLTNPFVWWAAIVTVPWAGFAAWREHHRGMLLLVFAYLAQWLPWAMSPRIDFNYNIYPNLAIVCLCSTYILAGLVAVPQGAKRTWLPVTACAAYLVLCAWGFYYFFPIWSDTHITWQQWFDRMWIQGPIIHGWI